MYEVIKYLSQFAIATKLMSIILLTYTQGELIGVIGAVGSGKSSLLLSILNEMRIIPNIDQHGRQVCL